MSMGTKMWEATHPSAMAQEQKVTGFTKDNAPAGQLQEMGKSIYDTIKDRGADLQKQEDKYQ